MPPPTNQEIELLDGSYFVPDIQDYIECIMKNYKTLTAIHPLHFYISRINNGSVFKIKFRYKLELQTPTSWNYLAAQKN